MVSTYGDTSRLSAYDDKPIMSPCDDNTWMSSYVGTYERGIGTTSGRRRDTGCEPRSLVITVRSGRDHPTSMKVLELQQAQARLDALDARLSTHTTPRVIACHELTEDHLLLREAASVP